MCSKAKRKLPERMHRHARMGSILTLCLTLVYAANQKIPRKIPVPPFANGGILSLWQPEHTFIKEEFGPFELLNFDNATFSIPKDSLDASSWKLVALGNFLPGTQVQYATVARLKHRDDVILLIMFEWIGAEDSTRDHGIFYHTVVGKDAMMLRTEQGENMSTVDTLKLSCSDLSRTCAKIFWDASKEKIVYIVTEDDRRPKK